jgi:hypothetical protein
MSCFSILLMLSKVIGKINKNCTQNDLDSKTGCQRWHAVLTTIHGIDGCVQGKNKIK